MNEQYKINYLPVVLMRNLFPLFLLLKLSILQGQVPVPVHEEPRHQPVFHNKAFRILNVRLAPGDTTLYHLHHTPSLFINFTSTLTGSQLLGGAAANGKSIPGRILFENLAPPNSRTHRVWNNDRDTFHVIDVELLYSDTGFSQKPLILPGSKLEVDNAWVRAYRMSVLKGSDFDLGIKKQSFILVSLNDAAVKTQQSGKSEDQKLNPGSFMVIEGDHSFSLKNRGDNTVQFVLLEFPLQ
jgi:hypothetical protein